MSDIDYRQGKGAAKAAPDLTKALPMVCNVDDTVLAFNIRSAMDRDLPVVNFVENHGGVALLIGGGPSVVDDIEEIKAGQQAGGKIFALNGAGHWLLKNGIVPDYVVVMDARPHNARFVTGLPDSVLMYLASQAAPETFEAALQRNKVVVWHSPTGGISGVTETRPAAFIMGGTNVGIKAMYLAGALGFFTLHMYGYDSSYSGNPEEQHAYNQPENREDRIIECFVDGERFISNPWMVRQADDFKASAMYLLQSGVSIHVHGYGLIPYIAKKMLEPSITVVCVCKSGGVYTPEWVYKLRAAVNKHLSISHNFICLTDYDIAGIECVPLITDWPRWWAKVEMFRPDMEKYGRMLYIDLDTVITGSIDDIALFPGEAVVTKDFWYNCPSQSILNFAPGSMRHLWEAFNSAPAYWMAEGDKCIAPHFGDQILFTKLHGKPITFLQDEFPGQVVSYKVDCKEGLPENARMVSFHGTPKPHELQIEWVVENWLSLHEQETRQPAASELAGVLEA